MTEQQPPSAWDKPPVGASPSGSGGQPGYGAPQGQPGFGPGHAPGYGPPTYGPGYGQQPPWNGVAIASLVLIFFFTPASFVLGLIARSQIKRSGEQGMWMAIVGIVVGALSILAIVAVIVLIVVVAASASSGSSSAVYSG